MNVNEVTGDDTGSAVPPVTQGEIVDTGFADKFYFFALDIFDEVFKIFEINFVDFRKISGKIIDYVFATRES